MSKKQKYMERASYTWSKDSQRLILTPSKTAKSTYFYVQEIGCFKTMYPYFTERQNLNSFLIVYTVTGVGYLEYRGTTHILKEGECFYINCMEHHRYYTKEDNEWEFLWTHFNGSNALGHYKAYLKNGFQIIQTKETGNVEEKMRTLIAQNQKKNVTTEIVSSSILYQLICELLIENSTADVDTLFMPDYIKRIAKEIEQNYTEDLSLDVLAGQFHRSKFYLAKEFKKYIGVTVHEYIILERLSYAKELLKYSDFSINEITYKIGMNNVSHFINLFRAREHLTPLSYRKEWQE